MKPLRAFLYAQDGSGEWAVSVYRDLEPLIEAAAASVVEGARSAAIHVGFWRPETLDVAALASATLGALLVSDSAACALPAPLSLSANSVGKANGIGFKLALEGFGYTIADPTIEAGDLDSAERGSPRASVANGAQPAQGWVAQMAAVDPRLGAAAAGAGVWDEASYQSIERFLTPDLRLQIGMARMSALLNHPVDELNILEHLWACPPWFMDVPLASLRLNVRENNVFAANNYIKVSDISSLGEGRLLKLPSLGRKSVTNVARQTFFALGRGFGLPRSAFDAPPPRAVGATSDAVAPERDEAKRAALSPPEEIALSVNKQMTSLRAGFLEIAASLDQREFDVWTGRLGIRCEPMTLQQIADRMRVTRARVGQIETKLNWRLRERSFWQELAQRLDAALLDRESALMIDGLSAVDPWFDGAESFASALVDVFKNMLDGRFSAFKVEGSWVVSRLGFEEWKQACVSARAILDEGAASRIEEDYARSMCDSLLVGKGEELRGELWSLATRKAVWSSPPTGPRRLVALGRGAEGVVQAVLESSGKPLHYSEIHRRAAALVPISHDLGSIVNAAHAVGLLFGRGTFGLISHCPLSEEDLALVRAEVEDVMAGAAASRQWHASELAEAMDERGLGFDGRLNKYVVNIALRQSPGVVYLRRMVWALKYVGHGEPPSRLDVRQAVLSLLEQEGRPLTTAEIRARIFLGRGVNRTFQFHASEELVRLGQSLWGIANRDIDIGSSKALLARLRAKLIETERGIHVTEMSAQLGLGVDANEVMDRSLLALAHTEGLRIDRGQYAYLPEWGGSRRVSAPDAARTILLEAGESGIALDRVCERLHELTERTFLRDYVIQTLRGIDAVFESQRGLWFREGTEHEDVDQRDEVDEDESNSTRASIHAGLSSPGAMTSFA